MKRKKENKGGHILIYISAFILSLMVILSFFYYENKLSFSFKRYSDPVISEINLRGTIYDRRGNILAFDVPLYGFLYTGGIDNIQKASSYLEEFLPLSALEISHKLDEGITFFPLSSIPSEKEIAIINNYIKTNKIENILTFKIQNKRVYPFGSYSFLGEMEDLYNGKGGIEELFNEELKALPSTDKKETKGSDLVLSIDINIEKILNEKLGIVPYILFNSNQEILALNHYEEKDTLSSLLHSITTNGETKENSSTVSSSYLSNLYNLGSFYLYLNDENKEALPKVEEALIENNYLKSN